MSAPTGPALGLAARNLCALAALLPGMLLQWRDDHDLAVHCALVLGAALVFEASALRLRRQPLAPFLREGSAFTHALVLACWLPALGFTGLLLSLFVALVLARQAFGGLGRNLFHPVAAGVAFAQLTALAPAVPATPATWSALAWLLGGIALLALQLVRWQAPVLLLAGACAGAFATGQDAAALADPRWMLAAFFVAGDPVTSAQGARARAWAAAVAGLLAGLAGIAVLPFALMAMNAATPMLDSRREGQRLRAQRA